MLDQPDSRDSFDSLETQFLPGSDSSGTSSAGSSGWWSGHIPAVLRDALPKRLMVAGMTYAGIFALNLVPGTIERLRGDGHFEWDRDGLGALFVLISSVLAWVSAKRKFSTEVLVRLGLAFEVFGSFGIALVSIHPVFPIPPFVEPGTQFFIGIPWTCVWIATFPLMVPSAPRQSFITGVLASLACPLAILFRLAFIDTELPPLPGMVFGYVLFFNILCAIWGGVGSAILFDLGRRLTVARRLGSYTLDELIGRGGMGEVWRAHHRMLARPAAVKLILPEALGRGPEVIHRFKREARATARLQSPHSIQVFDYGISEDGSFYYVMEYLEGITLESFVQRFGPIPAGRVIHWLRQVCHSLAEAHHRELIHRDIKPANLFVCRYGLEVDFVKVLDFGLVKESDEGTQDDLQLTADHQTTGTPAYLAPEIALHKEITPRADIYSLGCVAYFLLTGSVPFDEGSPIATILAHVQQEPIRPSERSELEIAEDLELIILSCLEKDPEKRPQSATELDAKLAGCRDAGGWDATAAGEWWELHQPSQA